MTEAQAWALLALGAVSAVIALFSVMFGRSLAARRATLVFMREYCASPEIGRALALLRAPERVIPMEKKDREDFIFLMNMFETLAIGLARRIYDKKMVLQFFGRDLKKIWENALPFVTDLRHRENDPDAFVEFEKLAVRVRAGVRIA